MDANRERALTLAQEAEGKAGTPATEAVIERARAYFAFLMGKDTPNLENPEIAGSGPH